MTADAAPGELVVPGEVVPPGEAVPVGDETAAGEPVADVAVAVGEPVGLGEDVPVAVGDPVVVVVPVGCAQAMRPKLNAPRRMADVAFTVFMASGAARRVPPTKRGMSVARSFGRDLEGACPTNRAAPL